MDNIGKKLTNRKEEKIYIDFNKKLKGLISNKWKIEIKKFHIKTIAIYSQNLV